jgi:hypothetical protein
MRVNPWPSPLRRGGLPATLVAVAVTATTLALTGCTAGSVVLSGAVSSGAASSSSTTFVVATGVSRTR